MTTHTSSASARRSTESPATPYLWVLGIFWLLPALVVACAWLALPKDLAPGQCRGIGFGCTLSPADTALLLGVGAAPVFIMLGMVGLVIVAVIQLAQGRSTTQR